MIIPTGTSSDRLQRFNLGLSEKIAVHVRVIVRAENIWRFPEETRKTWGPVFPPDTAIIKRLKIPVSGRDVEPGSYKRANRPRSSEDPRSVKNVLQRNFFHLQSLGLVASLNSSLPEIAEPPFLRTAPTALSVPRVSYEQPRFLAREFREIVGTISTFPEIW